jgi:hypothetical protein
MDNLNTIGVNKNTTINSIVNAFAKRSITDNDKIAYIKVLLLKTILMVVMEDLRETNIYQKGIKKAGNEFYRELQKGIFEDRYFDMIISDPSAVEEMEKSIEEMSDEISKSTLGCFAVITETIKKYNECPDFVLDRLNIIKGESEEIEQLNKREDLINRLIKLPFKAHSQIERVVSGLENIYNTNS